MRPVRALLLCCLTVCALLAQNDRGTITGTVLDQASAVIPNAKVTAVNAESKTEYRTVTTGTGNYTIPGLPAGAYRIEVEAAGFKKYIQENIEVQVAQTIRIEAPMQIGSTSETITVEAEAALLKTETAEQSTIITGERINELPLNFGGGGGSTGSIRSPYLFNILSPGVADNAVSQGDSANVNGLPTNSFRVQVDGLDATSQNEPGWTSTVAAPAVDMIQEFSLQTSNYAAEFGQAGGGLYNYTMKSGSNAFHGSGYEYLTNEALDAFRPFTYVNPRSRKNDFGGTISGPVWIPKIYNGRNRTFFFFNEEIYRNTVNSAGTFGTMPTAQMRTGDFSQFLTGKQLGTDILGRAILENAIYDPASVRSFNGQLITDPFTGNIIPPSRIDPVAAKIQALIPAPSTSAITNNWAQNFINYKNQQTPAFKIDEILPDTSKLSFYFSKQLTNQLTSPDGLPGPITAVRVQAIYGTTFRLNYDRTLTPTMLLHVGIGYQRFHNPDSSPPSVLQYDIAGALGFTGAATTPGGFPKLNGLSGALGGGSSIAFGPSNANSYFDGVLPVVASGTWVKGNHTFKIGGEFHLSSWTDRNTRGAQGILNFSTNETGMPYLGTTSVGGSSIGYGYASFLLGLADTGSVNAVQDPQLRKKAWGLYLQDTWKITRKLTLDYGLRWDLEGEGHEIHYRTSMFGPTIPNAAVNNLPGALVYEGYGTGRCNCQFTSTYPYALGPRLGLAYQWNQKTVIRAGIGVSYASVPGYSYITNAALLGVGFNQLNFTSPGFGTAGVVLKNGLIYDHTQLYNATLSPSLVPNPGQLNSPNYFIDRNGGRPPRILNWSIGFQREVVHDLIVEASYVGNRGAWENATSLVNLNAPNPATLTAKGVDVTTTAGQQLLLSTFASGTPQKNGFALPYPGFPMTSTLAQALRPFPQFGNITDYWSPIGDSWYNSLQAKATKRFTHGLSVISAFTWSKSLINPGGTINNVFNRANQKSIASYDQPLIFNTAVTYELQNYGRNNWVMKNVVAGWTLGGLFAYSSGLPIAVPTATGNQSSLLFQNTLMNRVPGQPLFLKDLNCHCIDPNKDFVLNAAAWANPTPGTWGTSAPYYNDFRFERRPVEQMSLGRRFHIRERQAFELRAEFFNIFNRTYLANPSLTAPTSPQARNGSGIPTSGWGWINPTSLQTQPRNGQIVARFTF